MIQNSTRVPFRNNFASAMHPFAEQPQTVRVIFNAGQSAIDAEVIEVSPHGMHLYVESASCLPAICMIGISSSDRLFSAHIIARTDTDLFVEFD